jgi:hypothetical protein
LESLKKEASGLSQSLYGMAEGLFKKAHQWQEKQQSM